MAVVLSVELLPSSDDPTVEGAHFDVADDVELRPLRDWLCREDLPEVMTLDLLDMRFIFRDYSARRQFANGLEMGRILSATPGSLYRNMRLASAFPKTAEAFATKLAK
jgi:hypothetical protein